MEILNEFDEKPEKPEKFQKKLNILKNSYIK